MDALWAIILAAGESKRMGSPKMLLPFSGSTMLETVLQNVKGAGLKNIIVVLGEKNDKILELVSNAHVMHCYNDDYKSGMLSSVQCGFRNIPEDFDAALVFQGDQPLISPLSVRSVIEEYISADFGIVIPVFAKKRGHPILIDSKYRDKIEKLDPSKGLRSLASLYPEDVLEVETNDPGILRDFDTYEDYINGINQK